MWQLLAPSKLAADVVFVHIQGVNTNDLDATNSFDSIMRSIPPNSTIYIGPGVFPTRGVYNDSSYPNRGFRVKTGWTIVGQGKQGAAENGTTLLLKAVNSSYQNIVIRANREDNVSGVTERMV